MFCALSGEAPELPVLSRVSGNIFEKRLLDAYVAEHGKDPVNGEELSQDDIVEIKTSRSVKPRPPTATSIPSLLSIFQNEWDALALESYQIKQLLHQTRQELSTALYQHDAACRVIARIMKERDEAREALSKVSENINGSGDQPMQTDAQEAVIPQKVQDIANATMEQESAGRKKRKVPEGWTTAEDLSGLKHARNRKADVELLDSSETPEEGKSLALHPSGLLVAASNNSSSWTLSNAEGSEVLATVTNDAAIRTMAFHPDGHLLALGCDDGKVYIFHLLTAKVEAVFGPADGAISSVAFSENGFWLAVADETSPIVKIWHLGKGTVAAELEVPSGTRNVAWDYSGQFLACVGAGGLKVWAYAKAGKKWSAAFESEGDFKRVAWRPEAKGVILEGPSGRSVLTL